MTSNVLSSLAAQLPRRRSLLRVRNVEDVPKTLDRNKEPIELIEARIEPLLFEFARFKIWLICTA